MAKKKKMNASMFVREGLKNKKRHTSMKISDNYQISISGTYITNASIFT